MPLKSIQHHKVYLEAMIQIRTAIYSGEFRLGDKLPSEQELCKIFQISRASVREALSGLTALGLIQSKAGGGYYVKSTGSYSALELMLDQQGNPLEILEARNIIEPEIVKVAARRREKKDLELLKKIVEHSRKIRAGGFAGPIEPFIRADMELHLAFARATHNDILISILERLLGYMKQRGWSELKKRVDRHPHLVNKYWAEHEAICESIRKSQPYKSFAQMRAHLLGITQDLLKQVEYEGGDQAKKQAAAPFPLRK